MSTVSDKWIFDDKLLIKMDFMKRFLFINVGNKYYTMIICVEFDKKVIPILMINNY